MFEPNCPCCGLPMSKFNLEEWPDETAEVSQKCLSQ